ncbi:unnamed protein product [Ambrosiozyma monospora]|uniref:Unnamed protein product n=1 Tax=Ambrosiozyma monospora TaxID=43982 RepID=A0ACB5SV35_AMBMO|nr:unnamed protein product [Ambrosiozyma monospora]
MSKKSNPRSLKVAIEGCCHGMLNNIYRNIPKSVELLIICGDFQTIRNQGDLKCIAVPQKYLKMGDFADYYTGRKKAPVFTIFIGGNHEASNYLEELKYGGFVAPNIYYLGETGVVWYKEVRIVGWSGIYNKENFMKMRESAHVPFNRSTIRSVYHYRKDDYLKLRLLKQCNSSVVLSHDWPHEIHEYGNRDYLLKKKPFFKSDMEKGELGSPANTALLRHLKPRHWFSAHLHVRFLAKVAWNSPKRQSVNGSEDMKSKKLKLDNNNDAESDLGLDDFIDERIQNSVEDKKDLDGLNSNQDSNADEIDLEFGK